MVGLFPWCLQIFEFYIGFVYGVIAVVYTIYLILKDRTLIRKIIFKNSSQNFLSPPKLLQQEYLGYHRFIIVQNVKLHYVESGDHKNPLLILVHGCPDFWFTWRKQIPVLAEHFWVVALDLRGCGDSEKPGWRIKYRDDVIAQDIAGLIKCLGAKKASIVVSGSSGQAVWRMAQLYPDLLNKLVFIHSPHPFVVRQLIAKQWKSFLFKYWQYHLAKWPLLPEILLTIEGSSYLNRFLKYLISSNKISEEEVDCYKYAFLRAGNADDWIGAVNTMRNIDCGFLWWDDYEEPPLLTTPTMLIMDDGDPLFPLESAYRTAELVERIQVRSVEGSSGRWTHVINSMEVNILLKKFLIDPKKIVHHQQQPSSSIMGRVVGAGMSVVSSTYNRTTSAIEMSRKLPSGIVGVAQSTISGLV